MSVKIKKDNWLKTNSISILSIAKATPQRSSQVHTSPFGSTGFGTTTGRKAHKEKYAHDPQDQAVPFYKQKCFCMYHITDAVKSPLYHAVE